MIKRYFKSKLNGSKWINHSVNPKATKVRGLFVPTSVAIVDELRKSEFIRNSKIDSIKRTSRTKLSTQRKGVKLIQKPINFMIDNKINSKTMVLLLEAFLKEFSFKDKFTTPRNAEHVLMKIRAGLGRVPEQLIQKYSNWVYEFTLMKTNKRKLEEFKESLVNQLN